MDMANELRERFAGMEQWAIAQSQPKQQDKAWDEIWGEDPSQFPSSNQSKENEGENQRNWEDQFAMAANLGDTMAQLHSFVKKMVIVNQTQSLWGREGLGWHHQVRPFYQHHLTRSSHQ